MKTTLSLLLLASLALAPQLASAYSSAPAGDPARGFRDTETKTVVKVDDETGYDDAISKGHALFYENGSGPGELYTVSRNYSGTYNTAAASLVSACIASKDVATGDLAGFPCVTKGFVDYALYSQGVGSSIAVGTYMCISDLATSKGRLVGCGSGVTSPFIALEAKGESTSGTLKIAIDSK